METKELVLDIGMHKGEDTRSYLSKGFRVVAVEANPLLAEDNKRKFSKAIAEGQLEVLNVGIAGKEGVLKFYRNHRLSEWSSFDEATGTRNNTRYDVIDVNCITTEMLFAKYGIPYYMKVDIEGFDHYCLSAIDPHHKPRYVSCEAVHLEWLNILKNKGYTKFKLINQGNNFKPISLVQEGKGSFAKYLLVKNGIKLRLQKILQFKYPFGSSGPFGEETGGSWKSYEELKSLYSGFYHTDTKAPLNPISWFDFHATY